MQTTTNREKFYGCLLTLSLMVSGAALVGGGTHIWRGKPLALLSSIAGGALMLSGMLIDRKVEANLDDYLESAKGFVGLVGETLTPLVKESAPELKTVALKFLPEKFKPSLDLAVERLIQEQWLPQFIRRSHVVVGESGSGKTTFLLFEVSQALEDLEEGGKLVICDPDYGSSHEGSEPNYWFHLPKEQFIRTRYEDIKQEIESFHAEMERRLEASRNGKRIKKPVWKLVVDEWIGFITWLKAQLEPKEFDQWMLMVGELLRRGLKQRVVITLGVQNLYTGKTGLSQADIPEFNMALLGDAALSSKNLGYLNLPENTKTTDLAELLSRYRKMPGCKYACIVQMAGQKAGVKNIPHLNTNIEIELPETVEESQSEPTNELEQWWSEVTRFGDFGDRFHAAATEHGLGLADGTPKKDLPSIKPFAEELGIQQRNSDERYQLLKQKWSEAIAEVQALESFIEPE